jgi:HEAT repeat protein
MDPSENNPTALIADLEQSDKAAIRRAVDTLIALAADEAQLRTTLNELLNDSRRKRQWPIAYILGSLPSPSQATLQVLAETLDSSDPDIRWAVALLLVRLAKSNAEILGQLITLATTGGVNQRRMAIYCLRDVGLQDEESRRALLNSLRDLDPLVRVAAATSLKIISRLSDSGKQQLLECFSRDPDFRVRNAAAITLAQMGSPSEEFLAALRSTMASDNPQLKKAASAAFALLEKRRAAPTGG